MKKQSEQKVISIKNLTIQFVKGSFVNTAVQAVDLDIHKGEIVGLVGESGSGKTTIGRTILGLNSYSIGEIDLLGRVLPKDSSRITFGLSKWMARNVQMVFQDPLSSLHPNMKISSIVAEGLKNQPADSFSFASKREQADMIVEISDETCSAAVRLLNKKDAARVISEEESRQLARLRDSYPWPAVHNDFYQYMVERQLREATRAQKQLLEVIAEDYDELYENKALFLTSLAIARKEKFIQFQKWRAGKSADQKRVNEKVDLASENYRKQKAALMAKTDLDISEYKSLVSKDELERIKVKKLKVDKQTKEKFHEDFVKLRAKYLKDVGECRRKFLEFNAVLGKNELVISNTDQYKEHLANYLSKKAPPSRKTAIGKRVADTLYGVQLNRDYLSRYASQLSGGQQQRIGIARAIAVKPKLLVADEPISSLDVSIQAQVVNIIKDLNEQEGLSVLFIAHDLRMVRYISDRIAVMHRGRIVETGLADEVYNNAHHPYTQNLLKAVPSIERVGESLSSNQKVEFIQDDDHNFFWYWLTPSHKVLATDEEAISWKLNYVRKEASNYMAGN